MPDKAALGPENRALYGEILRAPMGYEIDVALATTYTLDFETALVIPSTLAFHAAENRQQTLDTPLALLEGLERLSTQIAIFCEAGRIKAVPKAANRLTALLEDMVTEVAAPRGGAFHPKLWVLRFTPTGGQGQPRLRLALLSRNLTTDTSWDLSLCLDGVPGDAPLAANVPLVELVDALPGLFSGRETPVQAREIAERIAADVATANWDLPENIRNISFAVNGLSDQVWFPRIGNTLGIISPFMTDSALNRLARNIAPENASLLGREEEMALLRHETLERFGQVMVLDGMAETEDGEETEEMDRSSVPARGLHAKAFITERYSSTEITLGSGNATAPALLGGENVEIFATLSGYTRHLGTVKEQFSPERLGRYLREFIPLTPPSGSSEEAADRLDEVRRKLAKACPSLHCTQEDEGRVALRLSASHPVILPEGIAMRLWPLVMGSNNGIDLVQIDEQPRLLGRFTLKDITRWIGVRILDEETRLEQIFTLGTELIGLPEARNAEILRSIIENREKFLQYIQLLLGDVSDATKALFAAGTGGSFSGVFSNNLDAPILEDMVRALSGDSRQLRDIERLVARLSDTETGESEVIPPEFLALWRIFQKVLPKKELPNV